ncbi:MAG: bifunctional folylpolyglutamate synthase/dihydrofolate synthase [Firmicutes bacterium]|nr:bifunctional folylpolyglutamate synthase/dihydrofolate synthase [Bacillota bacterium]
MEYAEALAKLHSLNRFGIRPGLSRVRELLRRLSDPQLDPKTRYIHVAGTNGKGSCGAMLESVFRVAGKKTGFFSSPHLLHHCERYRIDGRPLPEADFARLFTQVWERIGEMEKEGWETPTEFEAVTALSLLAFGEAGVEWAVMECGLGGLYDSTNVIPAEIALITNVGFDHMDYLGSTVEEIAAQKAGIIHAGQTVITAAEGAALSVIEAKAREHGDPLLVAGRDFEAGVRSCSDRGFTLDVDCAGRRYCGLELPLLGRHQVLNAACAIQAAETAGVPEEFIREGLAAVRWPCRLEPVSREPLVIIDGAHNEPGLKALAEALELYWPGKRICGLIGMLDDKQREQALSHILPRLDKVIVTRPGYPTRSRDWAGVGDIARAYGKEPLLMEDSAAALDAALDTDCDMVLICGSLYLAADLRGRFPCDDRLFDVK